MRFQRLGKTYQLVIKDGDDLKGIMDLDEALWMAMCVPDSSLTCDSKFISLMDADKSGAITTEEIKGTIRWLLEVYPNTALITEDFSGTVKLSDINTACDNGAAIDHSARYINCDLGKCSSDEISLNTVREFQSVHASRPLNGDGVLTAQTATECRSTDLTAILQSAIADAIATTGGTKDLSGEMGVTLAQFTEFMTNADAFLEWKKQEQDRRIMPFGSDTTALYALFKEHSALVDDFFGLCDIQHFDIRFMDKVMHADGRPGVIDAREWPGKDEYLREMPLAIPVSDSAAGLSFGDLSTINPLYRSWWNALVTKLMPRVLDGTADALTPDRWEAVKAVFKPYEGYINSMRGAPCASLPIERLQEIAGHSEALLKEAADLAARDSAVDKVLKEAEQVEKLLLCLQYMIPLCNNIVSFTSLYDYTRKTLFERGKFVVDGRWFNLAFPVSNIAAHAAMAAKSNLFVVYFEAAIKNGAVTMAVPVTIGDKGNLYVGKRGIFFDNDGMQYTARIVKVIENPVCLKEALAAPFSKFGKIIENRIAGMSSASEKTLEGNFTKFVNDPKAATTTVKSTGTAKTDKGSLMMGIGVTFAALSSALAFICKTLSSMSSLSILFSVIGVLLALLAPITLMAIVKLRRQDLAPMLEGEGWAMNSALRLTSVQRRTFSRRGIFPTEAQGTPRNSWLRFWVILLLVVILAVAGRVAWRAFRRQQSSAASAHCTPAPCPADCPVKTNTTDTPPGHPASK